MGQLGSIQIDLEGWRLKGGINCQLDREAVPLLGINGYSVENTVRKRKSIPVGELVTDHQVRAGIHEDRSFEHSIIGDLRIIFARREFDQRVNVDRRAYERDRNRLSQRDARSRTIVDVLKRNIARQRLTFGLKLERLFLRVGLSDRTGVFRVGPLERLNGRSIASSGFPRQVSSRLLRTNVPDIGLVHPGCVADHCIRETGSFGLEIIRDPNCLCRCRERKSARAHRQKL